MNTELTKINILYNNTFYNIYYRVIITKYNIII